VTITNRLPYELYSGGADDNFLDYVDKAGHAHRLFNYYRGVNCAHKSHVQRLLLDMLVEVPTPKKPTLRTIETAGHFSDALWSVIEILYPEVTDIELINFCLATRVNWTM
jgi:hypothetical protein